MNSNDPMAWLRQFQAGQPWLQMPAMSAPGAGFGLPAGGWPALAAMPWAALQPSFTAGLPGALPGLAAGFPGFPGFPGFQAAAGDSDGGAAGASGNSEVMARLLVQGRRYLELLQGLTLPGVLGQDGQFDAGKWLQGLKQMHQNHGQGLAGASGLPWFGAGDGNVIEAMVRSLVTGLASGIRNEADAWLTLPAFGPAREHQERIQALLRAWLEYQAANARHGELMHGSATRTLEVLEERLSQRDAESPPLATPRAVYDLLIDAAEEAFAEVAMSAEFARLSGELTNAQMRVRAAINTEIELMAAQFGLPTRTEVDSLGRKVQALTRELRRGKAARGSDAASAAEAGQTTAAASRAAGSAKKTASAGASRTPKPTGPVASPAARSTASTRKAAVGKTASKAASKTATRMTKKSAAKKTAAKSASRTGAAARTRSSGIAGSSAAAKSGAASRSRSGTSGKSTSRGSARAATKKAPAPVLRSTKTKG